MARFHVGQRVRILWSRSFPELAGQEGRVCHTPERSFPPELGTLPVAPDAWGSPCPPRGFSYFAPHECQLEPILDNHQPCEQDFKLDLDRLLEREGVSA